MTWDRSVGHPGNMSVETADNLCRQEGYRVMRGESAAPAAVAAPAEADVVVVDAGLQAPHGPFQGPRNARHASDQDVRGIVTCGSAPPSHASKRAMAGPGSRAGRISA